MDLYLTAFALGAVGLIAMAFTGFGRHSRGGGARHASAPHGHGGHAHSAHAHTSHVPVSSRFLSMMSPRVLFSVSLGLGTAGLALRPVLGGPILFAAALTGGIVFERFLVSPLWNFLFRFASTPALTLESAVSDEARAVTSFDANGQGLIAVELDGQSIQLLGTLQRADRDMHIRVQAGARLRIEEVDSARNRCIVSLA
ncbi:MAG: hypothetical protein ABR582_03775 [Gemmatimonadaceae bacterium]